MKLIILSLFLKNHDIVTFKVMNNKIHFSIELTWVDYNRVIIEWWIAAAMGGYKQ